MELMVINLDGIASSVIAQTGAGSMPLWRVVLSLLVATAAVALAVGAAGFAQRWFLERVGRTNLVGQGIFAIAAVSGAALWVAAFILGLVSGPVLSFSQIRPFTQGVAKSGVAMIAVVGAAVVLMAYRERSTRFGVIDGRRAAWRLGVPTFITLVIFMLLLEPLLVRAQGPRPSNEDFSISPLGYVFAVLCAVLIAVAGAWCASGSASAGKGRPAFGVNNWVVILGLLPVSFVAYRMALSREPAGTTAGLGDGAASGAAGGGWLASWLRWCFVYGIGVAACWRAGMVGMGLTTVNTTAQTPIPMDGPGWNSLRDNLPWRRFKRRSGKQDEEQQASNAVPARPVRSQQPSVTPVRSPSISPPPVASPAPPVSRRREAPPTRVADVVPPVAPMPEAKPLSSAPVPSKSERDGDFLPIDPKTGLIRADVLARIEKELEQDSGLQIVPHGRRSRSSRRSVSDDVKVDVPAAHEPAPSIQQPVAVAMPAESSQRAHAFEAAPDLPSPTELTTSTIPAHAFSRFRWLLLFATLAYAAMAYYASLVPLNYRAISWEQAVEQFRNIQFLDVLGNANRRADFIANIVLFVPIGFLAMGAAVFGRRSMVLSIICAFFVLALCIGLAYAIEFHQLWYPPRTVSQNDLIAEHIGAALGIAAWLLAGQKLCGSVLRLMMSTGGQANRLRLLQLFSLGLILFCLLPFDFTLSPSNILAKFRAIHVGQGALSGDLRAIGRILRDVLIFAPVGFLVYYRGDRLRIFIDPKSPVRTIASVGMLVCLVCVAIEGLKLFMVNGVVDLINIPSRAGGAMLGASVAAFAFHSDGSLRLTSTWSVSQRLAVAAVLLAIYSAFLICLLAPPWQMSFQQYDFWKHMGRFKAGLFINYYYSGEWIALANLTHYLLFFVPVGVVLRWALTRSVLQRSRGSGGAEEGQGMSRYVLALAVPLLAGLIIGGTIEMLQTGIPRTVTHITAEQVAKSPATFNQQAIDVSDPSLSKGQHIETGPMPDMTDLLAYMSGALVGWLLIGPFLQRGNSVGKPTG